MCALVTGVQTCALPIYRDHVKRRSFRFNGNVGMRFSDVASNRLYVSVNSIDQQIPSALTMEQALTTPRLATAGTIAGDHGRDIDSIRIQNRTRFDWGAGKQRGRASCRERGCQ